MEEKAKAERLAQAALEQAIEEQSVRMPPPAPPTAEGIVKEATSILRKATVSQEGELADAGLGVAVTAHLADVMQASNYNPVISENTKFLPTCEVVFGTPNELISDLWSLANFETHLIPCRQLRKNTTLSGLPIALRLSS